MGLIVAAVVAFAFLDGPIRWVVIAVAAVYEIGETYLLVRWSQRRHLQMGVQTLVGREAVAAGPLAPHGQVVVDGERWMARSTTPCKAGDRVTITAVNGLELVVRSLS